MKIGERRIIKNVAEILPKSVRIIASYAFPLIKNSCPGKIDKIVSSSGAPRKIEGR